MRKLITSFVLLTIISVSFTKTGVRASTPTGVTDTNRNVIDTTGILFLLDWKRVNSQWATEKVMKKEMILHGTHDPRKAVLYYGEKYRTGVYFCEIVKDPEQ